MEDLVVVRYGVLQEAVVRDPGRFDEAVSEGAERAAPMNPEEQVRLQAALANAMGELSEEDTGTTVMSSAQNGLASRLQSALVEYGLRHPDKLRQVRPTQSDTAAGQSLVLPSVLEVMFDATDWLGWMRMSYLLLFKPERVKWIDPPEVPESLDDKAVVAVFSDWATGLYAAPYIAAQVRALDRCDLVLHMGDTYYAGRDNEVAGRLVQAWPMRGGATRHRTLNGNHEMYSGGKSYFAALQNAPFGQSSSCLAFQNTNWLLIGLDTSYVLGHESPEKVGDLGAAQADWVRRMVGKAGARKVLLFSHHQPFTSFDNADNCNALSQSLASLLIQGRIYGWFFGHEHRLVLFNPAPQYGNLKARCMGHGGFPEFRKDLPGSSPDESQWISLPARNGAPSAETWDGPNPFICDSPDDPVKYSPHGYLVLEFEGPDVHETYFDPRGTPVRPKARL